MFKPHFGVCVCHGLKRLIVLKSGICKQKNDEIKKEKRSKRLEGSVNTNIRAKSKGNSSKREGNDNDRPKDNYYKTKQFKRTGNRRPAKLQKVRKPTGELILFKEIYEEREPWCEWCGAGISEFSVANYHHIKPKSKFPELRLVKSNIVKICFNCHFKTHNG